MAARIAGQIFLSVNGEIQSPKGNFTWNLGRNKRTAVIGSSRVEGYMDEIQTPFIEGEIVDRGNLDLNALLTLEDATVTLELANGKTIVLRDAWYASEGTGNTEEGNIGVRFEGLSAEEG